MKNYLSLAIKGITTLVLLSVFDLNVSGQLYFSAGQDISICQGQSANIISTVTSVPNGETVTYSWTSNPGNYQSNIANPTISNLPVGTYLFTGTAFAGASAASDQVFVVVYPSPATPTFTIPTNGCPGVAIPVSGFTPSQNVSYSWSPSSNMIVQQGNTSSPSVTFNNGGNYNVSVTATQNGCSSTSAVDQITITNLSIQPPTVASTSVDVTYNGGTYTLCAAASNLIEILNNPANSNPAGTVYNIAWGNPPGTPSPISSITASNITLLNGNNYFTLYASNSGCTISQNYNIYAGSNPFVSAGVTNSNGLCTGQTVDFLINANNPFTNAPNSPGTTYTLVVSDNPSSPTVFTDIQGTQTIPHTFTTSSCGQPGGVFPANTFYATILASNACGTTSSSVSPITVNSPPISNFTLSQNNVCVNGLPVTVTNTGQLGSTIGNSASNYACTSTGKFVWTVSPNSGYTVTSGSLGATNGNPWSMWTAGTSTIGLQFTAAGTYTIIQTFANACGQSTVNQTVVVGCGGQTFSIQPLGSQTLCQNATAAPITAVVTGTTDALSYQWYSNSVNNTTSGTLILGATSSSYSPPTATVGTIYYYCVVTSTVSGITVTSSTSQVVVNPGPTFTTQPAATQSVCVGGATNQMCVAYANGTGTPTYQWYSNTVNSTSNGTAVSGATASCFTPPSTTSGTTYYYSIINLSGGGCSSITSNTAEVIVIPDPVLTAQPLSSQTICVGGTIPAALSVAYTGGIGTPTYQWYTGTPTSAISGATNASYTPPAFTTPGTFGYYATITLAGSGCGSTTSQVGTVVVVADPTVTAPIATQTLCQTAAPAPLAITAAGGTGTFLYQWYSNTTNNNILGTLISGATANSYSPPTTTVGTLYYYCVVTTAASGCSVTSAPAAIIVTPAPTFTTQPTASSVCVGGTPAQMCVAYANGTGSPAYQWYSNAINNIAGGMAITGATSSCYTPPSAFAGTTYYYAVISLTGGGCSMVNFPLTVTF